jgi:hypothetical protein
MTTAFAVSAASTAVTQTAALRFLAAGNRWASVDQAVRQPFGAASATRLHRQPAVCD